MPNCHKDTTFRVFTKENTKLFLCGLGLRPGRHLKLLRFLKKISLTLRCAAEAAGVMLPWELSAKRTVG